MWHLTSCNACHKTTTEVCCSGLNQTAGTHDRVLELSRKGDTFPTIVLECETPSLCSRDEAQGTWFQAAQSHWLHLWIFYQSSPCKRHSGRRSWLVLHLALYPLALAPIKFWRETLLKKEKSRYYSRIRRISRRSRLTTLHAMFIIPWDVKEPAHLSQRVGHLVPGGVVCLLCCIMVGRVNFRRY